MECKLKKQEIVFDTAVFTYELLFENNDFIEYKKAVESRKDTSMPIRAGVFFDMFPFCILYEVKLLDSRKIHSHSMVLERHGCEECWPGSSILHSTNGGSEDWKLLGNFEKIHKIQDTTTSIFRNLSNL